MVQHKKRGFRRRLFDKLYNVVSYGTSKSKTKNQTVKSKLEINVKDQINDDLIKILEELDNDVEPEKLTNFEVPKISKLDYKDPIHEEYKAHTSNIRESQAKIQYNEIVLRLKKTK